MNTECLIVITHHKKLNYVLKTMYIELKIKKAWSTKYDFAH